MLVVRVVLAVLVVLFVGILGLGVVVVVLGTE